MIHQFLSYAVLKRGFAALFVLITAASLSESLILGQIKPVEVSGQESGKLLIQPHTAPEAIAIMHLRGILRLKFTVLPDGTVTDIVDIDHNPEGTINNGALLPRAKNAMGTWKYRPYLKDGHPVAMRTTVELHWEVDHVETIYK